MRLNDLASLFKRPGPEPTLLVDEKGFSIIQPDGSAILRARWDDIVEVVALKADLWSTDLVCFDVRLAEPDVWWTVHEEQQGFQELAQAMAEHLHGFDADWFPKVAFPPMEPCVTALYHRAAAGPAGPEPYNPSSTDT